MMKKRFAAVFLLFPIVSVMQKSLAQDGFRTYQLTGVLEKYCDKSSDKHGKKSGENPIPNSGEQPQLESMIVDSDGERYEFVYSPNNSKISKAATVGDLVTIWYTFKAEKMTVIKEYPSKRPNQFPHKSQDKLDEIDPMEYRLRDDRIFYDS